MEISPKDIALALRASLASSAQSEELWGGIGVVLRHVAEKELFDARRLGPPDGLAGWSCQELAEDPSLEDLSDEELVERWRAYVQRKAVAFAHAPAEFLGGATAEICVDFFATCARVFGVDDERAAELIVEFHGLDEPTRVGVLLAIEESESFEWLTPWIDAAPDDTEYVEPTRALRTLMQLVFAKG